MSKKSISILIPTIGGGGAERVAYNLANKFYALDYEINVVFFYSRVNQYDFKMNTINLHFLKPTRFQIFKRLVRFFDSIVKVYNLKIRLKSDIYISFLSEANILNVITKRKNSLTILTDHNLIRFSISLSGIISNFARASIYRFADYVVAPSEGIVSQYMGLGYDNRKVQCIPNPIFVDSDNLMPRNINNILAPKVVTVGRLVNQKSQWILIATIKELTNYFPDIKLSILGEGENHSNYIDLIREYELQDNIELVGFVTNVNRFMDSCDVFILTSQFEGFGMVIIEALAIGLPVISTDCKYGPSEIICDNKKHSKKHINYPVKCKFGYLVGELRRTNNIYRSIKSNDHVIHQIKDAVLHLVLNENNYYDMSKASLERVKDYDIEKIFHKWELLID
jgi:glycosyltransferase involved in cell wall biosynthesis